MGESTKPAIAQSQGPTGLSRSGVAFHEPKRQAAAGAETSVHARIGLLRY
jgi:hypothetical protein